MTRVLEILFVILAGLFQLTSAPGSAPQPRDLHAVTTGSTQIAAAVVQALDAQAQTADVMTTDVADDDVAEAGATEEGDAAMPVDEALVAAGRAVYRQNYCGTCHTLAAAETSGVFGPAHDHVATLALDRLDDPDYRGVATNAAEYIRESILKPEIYIAPGSMLAHQQMPPFTHLSADDVDALVYFLMQQK